MRITRQSLAALSALALGGGALIAAPSMAFAAEPIVKINEVESSGGQPGDWIELKNVGDAEADLSGWIVKDNDDSHAYTIPAGTKLPAGEFLVLDELQKDGTGHFDFGLGGADSVRLFEADGTTLVDGVAWDTHAEVTYGLDGNNVFTSTSEATKGADNIFAAEVTPTTGLVVNEVDSGPADAIELFNGSDAAIDLTHYELRDNADDHRFRLTEGTTIEPGGYLVVGPGYTAGENWDQATDTWIAGDLGFGLGGADSVRLYNSEQWLLDAYEWTEHPAINGDEAAASYSRCPDGSDTWALSNLTLGASNDCEIATPAPTPTEVATVPWFGNDDVTVQDQTPTFLEDTSGLDVTTENGQEYLYVVDNGTAKVWKLVVNSDGTFTVADGWVGGKRVQFAKDAGTDAKGPDAEGISVADNGMIYLATERDNADKGTNRNAILEVDPNAAGPDVTASNEWNLTDLLPQVDANTGIEAVEYVPNSALEGKLFDNTTGAPYAAANYPGSTGLFFVALEDNGHVYAFALGDDGAATLVTEFGSELGGAMGLDYDSITDRLYAACDNGCNGTIAVYEFNGTAQPGVTYMAPPASMPTDLNNEGFAIGEVCHNGTRAAWWTEDGVAQGALRSATIPCDSPETETPAPTATPTETATPTATATETATPTATESQAPVEPTLAVEQETYTQAETVDGVDYAGTGWTPGAAIRIELVMPDGTVVEVPSTDGSDQKVEADGTFQRTISMTRDGAPVALDLGGYTIRVTELGVDEPKSLSVSFSVVGDNGEVGPTAPTETPAPTGTNAPTESPAPTGTEAPTESAAPTADETEPTKTGKPGTSISDALAETGDATNLTWILVAGGVLVIAGVALFLVRARRGGDDVDVPDTNDTI